MIEFHRDAFSVFTGCMEFQYGAKESAAVGDSFVRRRSAQPQLCRRTAAKYPKQGPLLPLDHLQAQLLFFGDASTDSHCLDFSRVLFFLIAAGRWLRAADRFATRNRLKFSPKCHAYETVV